MIYLSNFYYSASNSNSLNKNQVVSKYSIYSQLPGVIKVIQWLIFVILFSGMTCGTVWFLNIIGLISNAGMDYIIFSIVVESIAGSMICLVMLSLGGILIGQENSQNIVNKGEETINLYGNYYNEVSDIKLTLWLICMIITLDISVSYWHLPIIVWGWINTMYED